MRTLINKTKNGCVQKEFKGNTYYVSFSQELLKFSKKEYFIFVRHIWQLYTKLKKESENKESDRQMVSIVLQSQIIDLRLSFIELKELNDLLNPTFAYAKSYSSQKMEKFKIMAFYN